MWWTAGLWIGLALLFLEASLREKNKPFWWYTLAVGAALLSLDESIEIHEQFGHLSVRLFGAADSVLGTNWVVFAVPIVILCGIIIFPFLRRLPRQTFLGLLFSAFVFLLGAVGFEMAFGSARLDFDLDGNHPIILVLHLFEETLEMCGVALACNVMLSYLRLVVATAQRKAPAPGGGELGPTPADDLFRSRVLIIA